MDIDWILTYLREALTLLDVYDDQYQGSANFALADKAAREFDGRLPSVRRVVASILGGNASVYLQTCERSTNTKNHQILRQAIYALEEGREVQRRLGPPPGPSLLASSLHPTVWDAAKSLWRSEHRRQSVEAAAIAVNAALQQRLGRRDVSNKKLVEQAFTLEPPAPGKPRLRVRHDDGSEVYRSLQAGVLSFGVGCFQALRNPVAHEPFDDELDEQTALEQLAAFSLLMRWVDDAELLEVEQPDAGEDAA